MFESLTQRLSGVVSRWTGRGRITEAGLREALQEVREALLEADVHIRVVGDLLERVTQQALGQQVLPRVDAGQMLVKILHDELVSMMEDTSEPVRWARGRPTVILLAGLQGAGKTTTAAKLGVRLRRLGRKPLLVAADVQRPAAVEQLRVLGSAQDLPVHHEPGRSPEEQAEGALAEARRTGRDTLLIDSAGRLHVDEAMMAELRRVHERVSPDATFLVCDAMTGQDAVRSAQAFGEALTLDGVVLTKLDGDARGGAALSVRHVTGVPVRFVGTGEGVDDLEPFHADRLAGRVLGMGDVVGLVERAQTAVDADAAEASLKGSFTLDGYLTQMRAIRKMGSLKDLVGHLPGVPADLDPDRLDDRQLVRAEAAVLSMTPEERRRPELIQASRKRRIARGSGTSQRAVDELLSQFHTMRRMLKQMKKGGLMSRLASRFTGGALGGMGTMPDAVAGLAPPARDEGQPQPRRDVSQRRRARKAERQRRKRARRRR